MIHYYDLTYFDISYRTPYELFAFGFLPGPINELDRNYVTSVIVKVSA
jgi:hypothetical protein